MKFFQVIGSLSILVSIDALSCHTCTYLENTPSSDLSCNSFPSLTNTTTCPDETGLIEGSGQLPRARQAACVTAYGSYEGNRVVIRNCGVVESGHIGTCNNFYWSSFTLPNGTVVYIPPFFNDVALTSCLCSGDNCNVHDVQETTTKPPSTGPTTTLPPGLHCYTCYSIPGVAGSLPECEDGEASANSSLPSRNCGGEEDDLVRQSDPSVEQFDY
ncbi:uncharacterized protein LOC110850130 [Folsomia candida]|uniref:uncharacterized protein LOC110850130 n=1 Tax=Folsomia candida TaxID=158441 RepID=UPI000B902375|nr:uncharacterized protein LOC110850130 [Folsomia candida]